VADQAAGDVAPVIVGLPGEIDVANVGHVYDLLSAALDTGTRVIVADLTGTEFCDAAGVRMLVMVRGQAAARDAQLRLAIAPGALLRRLLVLLRADHLLPVYATAQEASELLALPQYPLFTSRPPTPRRPEEAS
jgi:anti-sigma B factor antagonist